MPNKLPPRPQKQQHNQFIIEPKSAPVVSRPGFIGHTYNDRYKAECKLGEGSYGQVFKVIDTIKNQKYMILVKKFNC